MKSWRFAAIGGEGPLQQIANASSWFRRRPSKRQ
jgi:hypothetical protein